MKHSFRLVLASIGTFALCWAILYLLAEKTVSLYRNETSPKPFVVFQERIVTMWNAVPSQTHPHGNPCVTADGTNACTWFSTTTGLCAANDLPFGTRVTVSGLGDCTVHDRMAHRFGSTRIDWLLEGTDAWAIREAMHFGAQKRMIIIH